MISLHFSAVFRACIRIDPHWLGSTGSGSGSKGKKSWPKLKNQLDYQPFKMAFVPTRVCLIKYYLSGYDLWHDITYRTQINKKNSFKIHLFLWRLSLTRIRIRTRIRNGLGPWIRIWNRIEIKSWSGSGSALKPMWIRYTALWRK